MKVLLVHPRLGVKGGGERVAIHSILAATKAGHQVSLVTEEIDESGFEDFFGCFGLFDKVERCYYPAFRPLLGPRLLLYQGLVYHWLRIRKIASKIPHDAILSTQDISYVPSSSAPAIQYCYFPETFAHLQTDSPFPAWRLYYKPASSFYRNRIRRVATLLSVSDYTRGFVRKTWGRGSVTLYPPCPVEAYSELSSVERRENLVVTIGRIAPAKRFDLFVQLARMVPRVRFVAIGSLADERSAYYDGLQKNAPDNVSFVLSPLRKARSLLGKAIAYVHCAENEHFGITIIEAMAAGCVPVVHDSGGPREIVTSEIGFRWLDLDTAARQITRLTEDDRLRRKLSTSSARKANEYRPEVFESKIAKILGSF